MKILVTGGAGYIGSHTVVELVHAGYDVVLVDNLSNSSPKTPDVLSSMTGRALPFYEADLRDREALQRIFRTEKPDGVIHLAGWKAVGESVKLPLSYYQNNLMSTITLLEVMEEADVRNLVFSSSATVYDQAAAMPLKETSGIEAGNPYGRTKEFIEKMLRDTWEADKEWSIVSLRYFNPAGAHPSGRIGEKPNGIPNNLMPYLSQVAAGVREELHVFGSDYPTPDGTGVRDYIHVCDLAAGHVRALEVLSDSCRYEEINLGTGAGTSVLELVQAYEQVLGRPIPLKMVERRPGDAAVSFADTHKAVALLQWKPERGVQDMCRDAWRWEQQQAAEVLQ
ncbi:UDP-glucose 4-epimerase GalE [Alkalicoccus chagannorensis]|uniref:UDP-glucose 4-epimerase GalE n=1 Tax=Alkalicoccus chagannorensis TaxID=427072 RepID=UPI0003FB94E7|nr:UDP-glucose 4-epimerase GalE [Alkalicoccus chagannorensis]